MIYLESSVALAHIFAEDRQPREGIWEEPLIASRLVQYEVWTRVNSRGLDTSHGEIVRGVLERISYVELSTPVLDRVLEPFPVPVRTLDALHLATMVFLMNDGQPVELASYDERLVVAAREMRIPVRAL